MMEEPDLLINEDYPQALGCLVDSSIVDAATRSGNILHTRPGGTKNIVNKGKLIN